MAFMDSKETIDAAIKRVYGICKDKTVDDDFCEDMLLTMIKIAYEKGRDDVHSGQSNDILSMEPIFSHTF